MPGLLLDASPVLLFLSVFAIIVGRMRREPWWVTAMTIGGVGGFYLGSRWAILLGDEAFFAVVLATGGMGLWTWAAMVTRRRPSAEGPHPSVSPRPGR